MNGKEFWAEIEAAQGYAYVSDSICDADAEAVRREAQRRLPWAQKVVKILRRAQAGECLKVRVKQAPKKDKKDSQTIGWFKAVRKG